jgi:hypothetical protein
MQTSIFNREPRPCILARLACIKCGPMRMALAPQDEPITALECPYCFGEAKVTQIGTGRTLRNLPYFEFEAKVDMLIQQPPKFGAGKPRLSHGQLVVFCQETSILHLAAVGDIHTNRANLSLEGIPSISFTIGENATGPVPHVSAAPCPPWWCLPEEVKAALKKPKKVKK